MSNKLFTNIMIGADEFAINSPLEEQKTHHYDLDKNEFEMVDTEFAELSSNRRDKI